MYGSGCHSEEGSLPETYILMNLPYHFGGKGQAIGLQFSTDHSAHYCSLISRDEAFPGVEEGISCVSSTMCFGVKAASKVIKGT